MYIKYVKIKNFRGIEEGHIDFQNGVNFLIGHNNVGKSNILKAIEFVLNPYIPWWRRDVLTELDFYQLMTKKPINIEILMGCGRLKCIIDEVNKCPYFEFDSGNKSEICKFTEKSVIWDIDQNKFKTIDDISNNTRGECCVRLLMTAGYNEEEGFVETKHLVLNENGEEWGRLTQPMKEWIGIKLLASDRNPMTEVKMQYNSLLSKSVENLAEWRKRCSNSFQKELDPIVKELSKKYAQNVLNEIDNGIKNLDRLNIEGTTDIGIKGANENDIIRQVELSRKLSFGEGENKKEWELPYSRLGQGFQNMVSIILGAHANKIKSSESPGSSILMIEEPEQNLEPQLQRSLIKNIKRICGDNSQIIISTHSPYMLLSTLNLSGVQKLKIYEDGKLISVPLKDVQANGKTFFMIRKTVPHDLELVEALFSSLVVLWEGDCEAGFYQGLMRLTNDYPAEMLAGVNAGDGGIINPALWFKEGGYELIVVLDGDNGEALEKLDKEKIPYIALPKGKKIEHILANQFRNVDEKLASEGLLKSIGTIGEINWQNDFPSFWPALAEIFKNENKERGKLETKVALNKIFDAAKSIDQSPMPENLVEVLLKYKKRYIYESLAQFLYENNYVPKICQEILEILKKIWLKEEPPGHYIFDGDKLIKRT